MEDDEPLRIAILGSGPVGIEAALYGRYLGYVVTLYDNQDVCAALANVDTPLEAAFREQCTPLGLAALDAQDSKHEGVEADQILSAGQWMERYCIPLSQTDLVVDTLRMGWAVESIDFDAQNETYRLVAQPPAEPAVTETFDYIIDTRSAWFLADNASLKELAADKTDDYFTISSDGTSLDFPGAVDAIRRVYAKIGERDDLNLYETLKQFQI